MMRQERFNFGIVSEITITTFMPAIQRDMRRWCVKLLMFLLRLLPKVLRQNQNVINEEVEISFRLILKTNSTM